ncbi:MAG: hypothetical protein FP820_11375 [Sulfurimonas sp.]|nr:hypothetical protein [Sulfurimonas sp.]MBU1215872.1 PQQ-like beta-propeller repeat protein [bacterium]MBU1435551.1 PQQ-like beta-propeller repeat protein [bacterium]MBU1502525.1 PQQ-like beta-propeller repeat protein [bacterium]MBU3940086.1 PQQ-like beta-propeller repeat protein [bacterium]
MKKILLASGVLFIILFGGCSTKEAYKPLYVDQDWSKYGSSEKEIVDVGLDLAVLEDATLLSKNGPIEVQIEESDRILGSSDGWVLSSNIDGLLTLQSIQDKSKIEKFELKKTIAAASVNGDILAVLFADNDMALYSMASKELLFKEQGGKSLTADYRIVNPYFMKELVLFPTLDGKVVIINASLKKKLRTVLVSSEDHFNNIIFFNVIDNKIIAASGSKMFSLSQKEVRVNFEPRDIIFEDKVIYITTKQGEVLALTPDLQIISKIKFPFAHFLGMIAKGDKIYLLEKEGYLIALDKDMYDYSVHEVDIEDGFVFSAKNAFYISDEYISVE